MKKLLLSLIVLSLLINWMPTSAEADRPTVTITPPTSPQNGPFDVTVDFSEDVTGFVVGDLTVANATKASDWKSGDAGPQSYTITLTPTITDGNTGTVTIDVAAGVATDAATNSNTAATQVSVSVDKERPTVSLSGVPTSPQNGPFDLTFTFSEDVKYLGDLTMTGGEVANIEEASWKSARRRTVTIIPEANAEGPITVQIDENSAQDAAGNGNTASAVTPNIHIDTIRPTVSISDVPTTPQNGPFDLTVTFSEDVASPFSVWVEGNSNYGWALSGSGSSWTATITPEPNTEEDVTVQIIENTTADAAGNKNTASSETGNIHIDTILPTVEISDVPDTPQNSPFDLIITFSEDVTGFEADDLTLTGDVATATAVSGSGPNWTATITPNDPDEGAVTVQVNANAVTDAAGNANTAASTVTPAIHIDTIVPTVTITGVPTTEQNGPFDLTVTFSEDVTGLGDLSVTGGAFAEFAEWSGSSRKVTVIPLANAEGAITVKVVENSVTDAAGNGNTASITPNIHADTIVPTVAISDVPTTDQKDAFDLTITFSEDVTGFATGDLTVTGEATATSVSGSGTNWTATITPNDEKEDDEVMVTVKANTVTDAAGNANTASAATPAIHIDTILPTATITGVPTTEQNGPFDLTVTFSEDVTGFGDLSATGGASAEWSGSSGTVTVIPLANAEGAITVKVVENSVTDAAGNGNTASITPNIHADTIPPTVSVAVTTPTVEANGYETEERNAPYLLTVTFSEEVNGFAAADLTVTGPGTPALTSGSDGDTVYTVTVTPDADAEGDVTVTVNASTVEDLATNQNPAGSAPITVYIDTIAPTFTIEGTPVLQRINDFFDIRIVFSEEVNDFRPADFTSSDLVTPSLQAGADGASEYTVRMTPNEGVQGNLFIEVNAETAQDFALNLNAESVVMTQPVRIDTIAPTVEITDLPTGVKAEPFDVAITFAEAVNGFTTEDIALVGPATVLLTAGTDGDAVYTARVTPNANASGDVTLQIPAAVVEDLAGNVNLASDLTDPMPVNTNAPTVELRDVPDTVQLGDFSVMIVFSSDVEGFVLEDIEITGDAVVPDSTLLGTGSTYSLTITPNENTDGDVIITVPAGVAQNAAGKSNAASVPQTVAVAPSWMPDASLRAAFRERLGLDEGEDFTQQQLRAITTLELDAGQVTDVTGLEQATGLTSLYLSGNGITDITSLRRLTQLTTLDLDGNAITDLTPLSGLTSLTTLDLSSNALTDISPLENLTGLTTLSLSGNRITSISPLTTLTRLTTLNLNDNAIADFTPLAGLTALTTLELGATGVSSLNAISGLTGLTSLNVRDNSLTDIALLANLTSLTVLNLNDNSVVDIAPLASLTRLTTLELTDNAIDTVSSLTGLTLLTLLDLADNSITNVGPLAGLANLETLRLMGNPILNTAPLYPLTQGVRPVDIDIEVSQYPPWDVNADGIVDATDATLVTAALGQTGEAIVNPRTDVNGDGTVDNADLTLVTDNLVGIIAGAPATQRLLSQLDTKTLRTLDRETLETYLHQLRVESDGSLKYRNAIAMLESLLAALRPTETRLLANYPNPFNPETWLPYELAVDSSVEIFIYNARGVLVRRMALGHQPAGYYVAKSRAAYWNGRNKDGERVSSGVYFYQLRAGDISQLRKMVILK